MPDPTPAAPLLTVAQAAAALGRRQVSIRQAISRGTLAATWNAYARRWEIEPAEIARYQAEHLRPRKEQE